MSGFNAVPACPEDTRWTTKELKWYDWLNEREFTTLWIDGNHEKRNDCRYNEHYQFVFQRKLYIILSH